LLYSKESRVDFIYAFGPAAVGSIAAIAIASYCWNRFRVASFTILIWFLVALLVGQFAFFPGIYVSELDALIRFMTFGTLAFGPAAILIFLSLRMKSFEEALSKISTADLVLTQTYRIGGLFLIVALLKGDLPPEIGLISGLMDVAVAISAVALSIHLRREERGSQMLIRLWAVASLIDFGWATTIKFADFFGVLDLNPSPAMLGNPPLSIISLFALPLGIFVSVHLIIRSRENFVPEQIPEVHK
jgi:hypothetical protein